MLRSAIVGLSLCMASPSLSDVVARDQITSLKISRTHSGNVDMVMREQWGASEPSFAMIRHDPSRITIHHTASAQKPNRPIGAKLRSLQAFSQRSETLADGRTKQAWADIPYHFYIDANGEIAEGRSIDFVGDTNTAYDPTGHIAIVVEGNFEAETPSAAQFASLQNLIQYLASSIGVADQLVGVHADFASTACPGANLAHALHEAGVVK